MNLNKDFNFRKYITLKRGLIGGGAVGVLGLSGFFYVSSNDIENKIPQTNQVVVLDSELESDVNKIILLNGVGNINVVESDVENTQVIAYLSFEEGLQDTKSGIPNLKVDAEKVEAEGQEGTVAITATMTDGTNYFTYLEDNNLVDKIKIDYEILVSDGVTEMGVYNPEGNINVYNTDMSLNVKSYFGNVSLRGISPENYVIANTNKGDINIDVDNDTNLAYVSCAVEEGNVNIDFEEGVEYNDGKTPAIPKINNEIFSEEAYTNAYNEFLNQEQYEKNKKGKIEVGTKVKTGETNITN